MRLPQTVSHPLRIVVLALGMACCAAGCSKQPAQKPAFPAQGKVYYKGRPIAAANVSLHPKDASLERAPTGRTREDGSFKLTTYSKDDGAPAGEYAVTVTWNPVSVSADGETVTAADKLPDRYKKPETSNLTVKVNDGPTQIPTIELTD